MYEARLTQGNLLKKIVDAIKDLVTEANFDVNSTGFGLQAMDNSHVSLVALQLRADGFEHYRCDRSMSMGERRRRARAIARPGGPATCAAPAPREPGSPAPPRRRGGAATRPPAPRRAAPARAPPTERAAPMPAQA
jgi:hypothetical protein